MFWALKSELFLIAKLFLRREDSIENEMFDHGIREFTYTPWALTIWMEFSVAFFGQMELHFFLTKRTERIEPYHLIRSFGCKCFPTPSSNHESKSKTQVPAAKTEIFLTLSATIVLQEVC